MVEREQVYYETTTVTFLADDNFHIIILIICENCCIDFADMMHGYIIIAFFGNCEILVCAYMSIE